MVIFLLFLILLLLHLAPLRGAMLGLTNVEISMHWMRGRRRRRRNHAQLKLLNEETRQHGKVEKEEEEEEEEEKVSIVRHFCYLCLKKMK
jgi:hypothetical protein